MTTMAERSSKTSSRDGRAREAAPLLLALKLLFLFTAPRKARWSS
jgi:hypothetical protein